MLLLLGWRDRIDGTCAGLLLSLGRGMGQLLGHERGFSASTIGLILGTFTLSVTAVRVVIPWLAHRLDETLVVRAAMLGTGTVFALYGGVMISFWIL